MKKANRILTLLGLCTGLLLTSCQQYNYAYTVPSYPQPDIGSREQETKIKENAILPEEIKLSLSENELVVGDSFELFSQVLPVNTTDKSLSWTSSDMNVASVSPEGVVTGNGVGSCVITAKSFAKETISSSCVVSVIAPTYKVESVSLHSSSETIKVNGQTTLFADVLPENATNKAITWESSNEGIVTVDGGEIKGIAPGVATVTVRTVDGNKTASCAVYVKPSMSGEVVLPTGVTLSDVNKSTTVGESFQLVATVHPDTADNRTVTWSSSNTSIATVSQSGLVSALQEGSAIISARSNAVPSLEASCNVTVGKQTIKVTSVQLSVSSKEIKVGEDFTLSAIVLPQNAQNKNITWSSSNSGVATVTNGLVHGVNSGSAVITVKTEDGNKTASCNVSVKADATVVTPGFEDTGVDDAGSYDIKIWCDERIKPLMETQVQDFVNHFDGKYNITLRIDEVSEGNAASSMTEDVASGADIYVFAQDQLSKLKTAGALANITGDMRKAVIAETEADGVSAATVNNKLYAFPFTSDNGYFMYYDKRIIPEEDVSDIEKIIADCKAANKKINYNIFQNGFYTASYFMATGCYSNWEMDATNKFSSYDDNYNSPLGLKAAKGIKYLKANNIFGNSDDPSKLGRSDKNGLGACVSGIWNYKYAYNAIGENLGCAPMPYFTVENERIHLSSFSGYKLIGVKPQTDAKKISVCKRIARYLSSEVCQLERFNSVNWGPTNITALANEAVKAQPGLKALREQKPYSKAQVQCPSSWFSSVSTLASSIGADASDAEIMSALQGYEDNLESLLSD